MNLIPNSIPGDAMKWFKHDTDANNDAQLGKILMRYGAEGYALYWLCLEYIAAPIGKNQISFELKQDAELLAYHLKMDSLKVEEIMRYMVELGLFEINKTTQRITCLALAHRLENAIVKNVELKKIQQVIKNNHDSSRTIPENPGKSRPDRDRDRDRDLDQDQNNIVDSKLPTCPHDKIINLYHTLLPELPHVRVWTETRRRHLQARWREYPDWEDWETFFGLVQASPFLMGRITNGDKPPFRASLDWLVKPENFAKVIEGKYRG